MLSLDFFGAGDRPESRARRVCWPCVGEYVQREHRVVKAGRPWQIAPSLHDAGLTVRNSDPDEGPIDIAISPEAGRSVRVSCRWRAARALLERARTAAFGSRRFRAG